MIATDFIGKSGVIAKACFGKVPRLKVEALEPLDRAWLFMGPAGVGKTSLAMALAKEIAGHHLSIQQVNGQSFTVDMVRRWQEEGWYHPLYGNRWVKVIDEIVAALLGVEVANLGDIDPATISERCPDGRPFIDQNGVPPGKQKLEQFREAFELRNTPELYSTEDVPTADKIVTVKLFNPCGSETWYFTEFSLKAPDGYPDLGFSYVTGMFSDEWGYTSLEELANIKGAHGIGIEIDVWFRPCKFSDIKKAGDDAAESEALEIESQQQ